MVSLPKISIIIPVYNGSNYLANAIDCALEQTYENIEIIVVNDGSTDEGATEKIALSYQERIRYFYKSNGGVSSALNFGIANMTGEYFSWLSHDDSYSRDKIKNAVDLLIKNNAIGNKVLAFTSGYFIDSHGSKIKFFPTYFTENNLYSGAGVVDIMTQKGTLNGCCMLIPKTAFEELGGFDESLRYSQDSLMWYRIFLSGYSLISDNKPNVMYRLHRKQTSQLRRDLYEHDSLVIAKFLAESLSNADKSGGVIYRYIIRLTKNDCKSAIDYMYEYVKDNKLLNKRQMLGISIAKHTGHIRYRMVSNLKKMLFWLRHSK